MLALEESFISMCQSYRVKRIIPIANHNDDRRFFLRHGRSLRMAQTWRLHTKLYKFGWHTCAISARMKNSRPDSWRGCLYYNYLSYPRFLNLFIKWLRFLVLISWPAKTENYAEIVIQSSSRKKPLREFEKKGCNLSWSLKRIRSCKRPHSRVKQ